MSVPFLYKRLGYVALNVSDLGKTSTFYQDIVGLDPSNIQYEDKATFRCSERATDIVIYQDAVPGLRRVGFQVGSEADLEAARAHFIQRGYEIFTVSDEERAFLQIGDAFRVKESVTGLTFEFYANIAHPAAAFRKTLANIERVGHIVLRTNKIDECWDVLSRDFGMVSSDFVLDKAVWARCYPNPLHHSFALVKSEKPGLHHVNFMASDIDDIGRARNRLIKENVKIVYGPGRHMPSGSVFLYFHDPDGLTNEFSFGMETFPLDDPREPRMLCNAADTMDLWGGLPDPEFCVYGNISEKVE